MTREPVLYPRIYPVYIAAATLDILLTWLILSACNGIELNPIAAGVIDSHGMPGATFLKFGTVMFVMWACEYIGRRRLLTGRRLALYAAAMNCLPVTASMAQLAVYGPG